MHGGGGKIHGLIAQEVKQTLDAVGIGSTEFAGWCLTDKNNPDSTQSLRYSEFIAPIIKSIQEQGVQFKF